MSELKTESLKELIGENCTKVIDFYSNHQPETISAPDSNTNLLDIDGIIEESTEWDNGSALSRIGIYIIAVTAGGNSVCIDTNDMQDGDPAVLLIDHSFLYAEGDEVEIANLPSNLNEDDYEYEDFEFSYENVRKFVYQIEDRFTVFIQKFSNNEYSDLEEHL